MSYVIFDKKNNKKYKNKMSGINAIQGEVDTSVTMVMCC
jgi:hypothetical protein